MRKILLTLSVILAALALFFFCLTLALRYWFNPNALLVPLNNQLQQKTGLVLRLNGKLSWNVFPTAHISVKQLSLEAAAPKDTTNIGIQSLNIRLSLWPLITERKIIIDNVTLNGLNATLQANSFTALKTNSTLPANAPTSGTKRSATSSLGFAIKSITINDATIQGALETLRPGAILRLDHFAVKNLDASSGVKTIPVEMEASIIDQGNTLPLSLNSEIIFDATNHRFVTNDLQASINSLNIRGHLNAEKIKTDPQWQGQLTLEDKDAARTISLLTGTDNSPIKTLQGEFTLAANSKTINLSALNLKLNNDTITGSAIYDLKQHHLNSVFNADTLHWSTSNTSTAENKPVAQSDSATGKKQIVTATPSKNHNTTFSADSQLHIQRLMYNTLTLDNISAQLHYADKVITLNPVTVIVLQGLYQGKVTLGLDNAQQIGLEGTLTHLNLALLQQYLGAKPSITGLLDVKGTLNSQGQSQPERLANLNGDIAVMINQGSWTRLNMTNILSLLSLANGKKTFSSSNGFSSVSGNFAIQNGIATNPNLRLLSPLLSAKGNGTLNLVKQTLDYQVTLHPSPEVLQQVNSLSQWLKQDIPLTIQGPWSNPKIQLNQGTLIETKVQDQLDQTLKKVRGLIILR